MAYSYKINESEGHKYHNFTEFIKQYKCEMVDSIIVPQYSANIERDTAISNAIKKEIQNNASKASIKMNDFLRNTVRSDWEITLLKYQNQKETYIAVLNAMETLHIKVSPTIYYYESRNVNEAINSMALGYGNNINLFLSKTLFESVITDIHEKAFIIGHELGHNQANHTAAKALGIKCDMAQSRLDEYTADRAGLIACKDIEAAARILIKLKGEDLSSDEISTKAKDMVRKAETLVCGLKQDQSTHPCCERRIAALKIFMQSSMYAKAVGLETNKDMLSDSQLNEKLNCIISGGDIK